MKKFITILSNVVLLVPLTAQGVLFYSTGDVAYNTTAPTGSLTNSGWQFQGRFLQYLGTPIAPHHFITARHFGGSVGNTFTFDGTTYTTVTKIIDPDSDLALYEIDGTFPRYEPLYSSTDDVGKDLVVFGRGTQRGDAVLANGSVKGWKWGPKDYVIRWGENTVEGVSDYAAVGDGKLLRAEFNSGGGVNECMLSDKDSGGALFIKDDEIWKLAGINYTVGPATFSYSATGDLPFNAAMFDFSFWINEPEKIYYQNGASWFLETANGEQPCSFYTTRISSRYSWITNNIPDFDQDVDGLPDWWETEYGGDATSMVATNDIDFDGFMNLEEWLADTIPTDSNSVFRITSYPTPANLMFGFSSTNREYQIEYRLDLADTNETWQAETGWFNGSYSQTVQAVSVDTSNRFYRVRVKLP